MPLGDLFKPGPVGTVEAGTRNREVPSREEVWVYFIISTILLGLWCYYVVWTEQIGASILLRAALTVIYLAVAYFVHPVPDESNLGWFGGLINNPFRVTDDVNRFLQGLMILLWPGRFVAESFVDMARLKRNLAHGEDGIE